MAWRQAKRSARPTPPPRSAGATPVGPKKLRRVQSWQANPITPAFTAMKQDGGLAANAVSHSAAQAALKFARTQSSTRAFSQGFGRRTATPACAARCSAAPRSGSV